MNFRLTTTGNFYNEERKSKLETLGFKFTDESSFKGGPFYKDDSLPTEIEINTLEELIEFSNQWGEIIIKENEIEIYDNYRE